MWENGFLFLALMGNCWFKWKPSIHGVPSSAKSDSRKLQIGAVKDEGKDDSELPSNLKEVEDLCRDEGTNPLIAFTFKELKMITRNFRKGHLLGRGNFGCVYKGFISKDLRKGIEHLQVAVNVHYGHRSFQDHREWLAEVIYLRHLSHPNLVKLIGYCCEDEHQVLICEYMARGSVENHLFSKMLRLSWSIRMKIAFGAAKGLAFLHEAEKPVIYLVFRTSKILLDLDYNAKLSDFGFAKYGPVSNCQIVDRYGYQAPEYSETGSTAKSDVYSFGVFLLELLTGRKALDRSRPPRERNLTHWARPILNEKKLLHIIDPRLEGDYPIPNVRKVAMLAYHCLNDHPSARPLMRDIINSLEPLQTPVEAPSTSNS